VARRLPTVNRQGNLCRPAGAEILVILTHPSGFAAYTASPPGWAKLWSRLTALENIQSANPSRLKKASFAATFHEGVGLPRQIDPVQLSGADHNPFFHRPSMARIKARAGAAAHEMFHTRFGKFHYQVSLREHSEDLPLNVEN